MKSSRWAQRVGLQTSAIAMLALVGVITLGAGGARAQSTAEVSPGMIMNRGWYAGAVPPIRVVDGRRAVVVSAPESEWIVKFGPFMNVADCGSALSEYSHGSLSQAYYDRFRMGRARDQDEAKILADVQARNSRCIVSDGSERFRTPGRFETDPTTDFVR